MTHDVVVELTVAESKQLKECEHTIKQTKGAFVACGNALTKIRDNKLYRKTHKSFEDYCQERWGWTSRRANQLIEAAGVVKSLPGKQGSALPTSRSAEALKNVEPEKRSAVLEKATRSGKVTARSIAEAAEETRTSKDETGYPIPEPILEDWNRAGKTGRELLRAISDLRSEIRQGLESEDIIYAEVSKSILADLNNSYTGLKMLVPYAVCTSCQGHGRSKCSLCKRKGFIAEFTYRQVVPEETRKLREKLSA